MTEANQCKFHCKNLIGTFLCTCPDGFRQVGRDDDCEDINECEERPEVCGPGGRCLNTKGGFQCQCGPGFTSTEDGRGCLDRRRGLCYQRELRGRCELAGASQVTRAECCCTMGVAWGQAEDCQTCPRRGSAQYRDLCPLGQDIDECSSMPDLCQNGLCINTLGSYRCVCDRGYQPDISRTSCEDLNECLASPGPCEHECYNTLGSFKCRCPPGFQLNRDGRTCRDIDECATVNHVDI